MFSDSSNSRFDSIEICIDSIGNSPCHSFVICGIGNVKIIILVTHKSHFEDGNRNCTPVGTSHIVGRDDAFVCKSGGIAVTVDDTGCKRITFFDEFLVQILIGTGWGHGKSTGSRSTVVTVCMNADRDIGSGFCGEFCTFFVADGFVVILAGHDNLVPARCQFFFKDKRNFKVDFIFRNLGVVTGSTGRSFIFGLR